MNMATSMAMEPEVLVTNGRRPSLLTPPTRGSSGPSETIEISEDIEEDDAGQSYDEEDGENADAERDSWSESGSSKSWHSGEGGSSYSSRTTSGSRSRSSSTGSRSCSPSCSSHGSSYLDEGMVDGLSTSTSMSVPLGEATAERPYPQYPEISMYFMTQTTRPRTWCLKMLENKWFERVSMMAILLNCVTLGMYHPCADEVCTSYRCRTLEVFDDLIFAFFAVEMLIKMVAMGITGKGGYLVEKWNRIDFIIVLAGLAEYISDVGSINLTAVRTIRVLRPLRAINRIPSMRILVMLLLDTLPMLGNVLLLCFFVFFIFGIVGVQLWSGILRQRCHFQLPPNVSHAPVSSYYHSTDAERDYICSLDKDNGLHRCHNLPPLVVKGVTCTLPARPNISFEPSNNSCVNWNQYYVHCKAGDRNPFQGAISFDNIGLAWVAIFLVISLEGWTDIMYYIQDAHSFWDWIYFVLLIVIGSFFMINLCLVVIATQFSETKKREMERMRLERADSSNSTIGSNVGSEPTGCYNQTIKYIAHLCRHAKRRTVLWCRQHWRKKRKDEQPKSITLRRKRHKPPWQPGQSSLKRTPQPEVGPQPNRPSADNTDTLGNNNDNRTSVSESVAVIEEELPSGDDAKRTSDASDDITRAVIASSLNSARGVNGVGAMPDEYVQADSCEDLYAPCASPEVSDIDPLASPRRPNVLKFTRAGNKRASNKDLNTNTEEGNGGKECTINMEGQDDKDGRVGGGTGPLVLSVSKPVSQPSQPPAPSSPKLLKAKQPSSGSSRRTSNLTCAELLALSGAQGAALAASFASSFAMQRFYSSLNKNEKHCSAPQLLFYYPENEKDLNHSGAEEYWSESDYCSELDDEGRAEKRGCFVMYERNQTKLKVFVDHPYFQRSILLAILVNTLSMGIEYHNQPEELTLAVEISNLIFTAIFALEMALKILAEGFYAYISSGFNVFDGVIVILSVVELFQSSGSGLSVLRTFRLLRILKLVRFMPALRRQLVIMLRTIDNVAVFFALLILFIFIFSCLGMHLFGGKFCTRADETTACSCEDNRNPEVQCFCDRKNFDSFLWATVTVFQILTQEDWNVVLFNGMEKTSHWAALYFVALMTFGNYVLFNLLVAILVEGFSQDSEKKKSDERLSEELNEQNAKYHDSSNGVPYATEQQLAFYKDIDDYDPKDNIEKETLMLCRPAPLVAVTKTDKNGTEAVGGGRLRGNEALCFPPIITHTAATPQGSPNATLEPFIRDLNNKLSPLMAFNISASSIDSIDKSSNGDSSLQVSPHLSRTSSHRRSFGLPSGQAACLSVPRSNFLSSDSNRGSANLHPPPITTRNKSPSPLLSKQFSFRRGSERKGSSGGSSLGTPRLDRQGSIRGGWGSKRRARRKQDKQNLVDSDSQSASDPEQPEEEIVLNNMTPNPTGSQCNGDLPTIRNTPNNKRQMGVGMQINPLGSPKTLSPQNSIRGSFSSSGPTPHGHQAPDSRKASVNTTCSSGPSHPALTPRNSLGTNSYLPSRQNSIGGVSIKDDFKPNNLSADLPPRYKLDNIAGNSPAPAATEKPEITGKICFILEPMGCFENREDYALYLFGPENKVRVACAKFAALKCFDYVILVFIALNCITLAMERPNIPPDSIEKEFLNAANYIFTAVFGLEMLVKVIAKGLWYGEHAYFKSGWNVMDGTLVIISLVDLFLSFVAFGSTRIFGILRVFRLLRSLRPLRVINRAPGLKLVVQTLLSSLRPIGNIVLICCTFFIIFGILGVQLFKGSLYYCDGPDVRHVKNKTDCLSDAKNLWLNRKYNFDNLGQALMALFVLSSKDGWVNIMYSGLDAVGVDQQPIENFNQWRLLYFISFLLLVAFFVLNMFVGVVVENFHRCREEQEKEERAMRAAKRARKMEKKRRSKLKEQNKLLNQTTTNENYRGKEMRAPPYYINYSKPRLFTHSIVTSKYFDLAIAAVIGLNVVTMAMEFYMMPAELEYALKIFNYFFTAVFILEAAMKVMALGIPRYLKDKWNQLDVFIVCLSVCGIVLEEMKSEFIPINPTIIRVMRVLRIARVLKLLKMAKGIRALLDTVMQALPQVGNLGLLFFLLFFIFAALGVELFGRLECNEDFPCQGLGEHAHFRNFGMAFLTLFRVATGDNWNGIMKDTLRDDCDNSSECVKNCCVSAIIAPLYFVVFVLMAQFVLVNVVVAVLMKHLEESHKNMDEDIEMEIEREMVAEARQAQLALQHQARQANRRHRRRRHHHHHHHHHRSHKGDLDEDVAEVKVETRRRPLLKMSSLPANFVFTYRSDLQLTKDRNAESTPTTVSIRVTDVSSHAFINSTYAPSSSMAGAGLTPNSRTSIPYQCPENNVNLRQASPDEPANKVAVADLSHIPLRVRGSVPNLRTPPRESVSRTIGSEAYRSLPGSALNINESSGLTPPPRRLDIPSTPVIGGAQTPTKSPVEAKTSWQSHSEYSSYLENPENQPSLQDISSTSYECSSSNKSDGPIAVRRESRITVPDFELDEESLTSASFSVVGIVGCVSSLPAERYDELNEQSRDSSRTNSLVSDWGSDSSRTVENALDEDVSRASHGRTLLLRSSTEGEDGSSSGGPVMDSTTEMVNGVQSDHLFEESGKDCEIVSPDAVEITLRTIPTEPSKKSDC